jgi:neutral ceramidase
VQVFRLTDRLALVFLSGEIFTELGKAIKAAAPFAHTLVIELANDMSGLCADAVGDGKRRL